MFCCSVLILAVTISDQKYEKKHKLHIHSNNKNNALTERKQQLTQ